MPDQPDQPETLTPEQLVERYRGTVTLKTLSGWRSRKTGPAFTRTGPRSIVYAVADVEAWERRQRIRTDGR